MLGAIAGAEALEIIVLLKDLSEAGLRKLESNVKSAEHTANTRNFSGWSKATKGVGEDAERAAGAGGKGGIGALLGGFLGLPGPIAIAGVAIAGFAALTAATLPVYERVEKQEKALTTAANDHGIALDDLAKHVEDSITAGEKYAFTADDTREAIIKLTSAGMSLADQQAALPRIMDLARAKHIDLAEATRVYELALMGNARALRELGIALPKVTDAEKSHEKATHGVTAASTALHLAQRHLRDVEHELAGKHHLTAAQAIRLRDAHDKVREASHKLKQKQDALNLTQDAAHTKASRLKDINDDLTGAVGGQAGSISNLDKKQATLNDKWEKFATKIGPALEATLGAILTVLSGLVDALGNALDFIGKIRVQGSSEAVGILARSGGERGTPARHQAGGWVGLHGPEIGILGEKGPEFVVPNHALAGGGIGGNSVTVNVGFISMPTTGQIRQLADMIGRELRRDLARAAPTSVRT